MNLQTAKAGRIKFKDVDVQRIQLQDDLQSDREQWPGFRKECTIFIKYSFFIEF